MNQVLLLTHIISGYIVLLSGSIILSLKKGDQLYKSSGKIFLYYMVISILFSLPISIKKSNLFYLL